MSCFFISQSLNDKHEFINAKNIQIQFKQGDKEFIMFVQESSAKDSQYTKDATIKSYCE